MRSQQPDHKSHLLASPKYSPSPLKRQHPLPALITTIAKEQQHAMSTLSQKCSVMEYALAQVEVMAAQLAQRVQKWNESREAEMLGTLKIKQAEFIIGELRASLAKQAKKEQRLLQQISTEKKRNEALRQQNSKLQAKSSSLCEKVAALEATLKKKAELWESSNAAMQKIRLQHENEARNRNKSFSSKQSLSVVRNSEEYGELQAKIEQLEREFNNQIEKLVNKNNELSTQLKKYKDSSTQMSNANKLIRRQLQELSRSKYEIQIKARQDQIQMGQLEQMYAKLVEKSNNNEIMLHKQLQQYKVKQLQLRNQFKKEKKTLKIALSTIAEYINNSKYYFTANQIKDQVEQLKKLFDRALKKKLENSIRELEYYQAQHKKIKTRNDELQQKVTLLQKTKPAASSAKDLQGQIDRIQRASENGSLLHNRSHDRSQQEKRSVEDKFKSKLQALRKDIKAKQSKINQLEKMQEIEFDKNKQKILQLQLAISEKTNEIRKLQLKFKERQYQFGEYQSRIKQLQGKIKFLTEKLEGEKESNSRMLQIKTQNYEQKLKIVKNNYKELQRKQQEKTIKYNKLKSKYEKYQLQASQSLKRKNAQIDQLLKENTKYKTENKLLEEKININTIIQTEISKNKTPNNSAVNQDLIQQIQMERDRISVQLAEKQKKCSELIENNEKLTTQITGIRKQVRELKSKIQEMTREERFLRQQNKYAKQKIEQLTKNNHQQDETKHNYLKKQLQKSVLNVKKLEKAREKYALQRQQRKKQLQQKIKQIQSLKVQIQKHKERRGKLQSQLQDEKQSKKRLIIDYDRKLSECAAKEEQLVDIINYKNRQGESGEMRQSMKGEQLIIQQQRKIKYNMDTMTDPIFTRQQAINTDPIEHHETQCSLNQHQKQIIPSELILDNDYQLDLLEKSRKQYQPQKQKQRQNPKVVNYFGDLIMTQNEEDHFQICDDGQQVLQRVTMNTQLKQMFNLVRQSIQKVFNQEDISITTVKQLPKQLQEDFNDFISYIKEKILEIQNENNLTFIMAEAGNEPEDIQTELHEFLTKPSTQYIKLKKIIEQKQYMITSLMNEKTQQENTITQQQNIQQQAQRLHLQQYSVLKSQIHEQKVALDKQQLYYESLKNIIKKMMNFWIQDDDNYDDFQDNLQLITTIYKFNAKQMELLKLYLKKYRQLKQIP